MTQLAFPFPSTASFAAADLLRDASNAEAMAWLAAPARWPLGRLALWGPAGVGKSHMLASTATAQGWALLDGRALRGLPAPPARGVALDDADALPDEAALFHLINLCAEAKLPLLLAGREAPARWPVALADLESRLRATTAVGVKPPSDALLAALLAKHFADRQLRTEPGLHAWLLARLPREAAAMAAAAERLDQAALAAGGALSIALARRSLGGYLAEQDGCVTDTRPASPREGSLR
jgi:chromosomal replication initiation ATPase DnaA